MAFGQTLGDYRSEKWHLPVTPSVAEANLVEDTFNELSNVDDDQIKKEAMVIKLYLVQSLLRLLLHRFHDN